ncbi:MAG: response regulator transcription factor [Actinobacteria bacterium]|nr:response regulator transcription factor [Actinomycetota bacterium]
MTGVVLVTRDGVRREGLLALLGSDPQIEVVDCVTDESAVVAVAKRRSVDVVLADEDGLTTQAIRIPEALHREGCEARCIVLVDRVARSTVLTRVLPQVDGLLRRDCPGDLLTIAVKYVAEGGMFIDPALASAVVTSAAGGCCKGKGGPLHLTKREADVLALLPRGLSNEEIGGELGVGTETIKTHVRAVIRKLGVRSRAEAAAIAIQEGVTY